MSVAAVEPIRLAPVGGHLRLVPTLEMDVEADVPTRLKITRRGRLAATLSVVLALAAVTAITIALVLPASATSEIVVQPGQTLSEIAATQLPGLPLDRAIVQVQLANEMNTVHVQAGQTLQIP
ncbi:MAG: LysM peptidoglycan-binding domain-containing protein [Ornithinimicrobium sp.]